MRNGAITITLRPVARWFEGYSFQTIAWAFILLSIADLLATLQTVPTGILKEGNNVANVILNDYGIGGMILQKVLLVTLAIAILRLVVEHRPRLAFRVLWFSTLLMSFVALYHLTIFLGLLIG